MQAKDDRDGGDSTQFAIGPSIQFYLPAWIKLKHAKRFDLDDSKSRTLVFETGYRYLAAPDEPTENRWILAATAHFPMHAGFLLSDRSRADLDWKAGAFTWRYRNKLTLEKSVALHSYKFVPYIAAEPYYESQYQKWSTTALYVGLLLPVGKRLEFNSYYEHENNTGKTPNQQEHLIGLALYLFFRQDK